ncbi:MAG TPA: lactate utilization protein [Planctomycetes bacterium]|nr:lactate utilization protein [Planctomycetota bacterium]
MTVEGTFRAFEEAASDPALAGKVRRAVDRSLAKMAAHLPLGPERDALRDRARAIRMDVLDRLPALVEEFTKNVEAAGGRVFRAQDSAQARETILRILKEEKARVVVKSKSMTTEEIGLNPFLEKAGLEVVETDLGELIVQLRRERPSHITAPALHLSVEDIARTFRDELGIPPPEGLSLEGPPSPEEVRTRAARELSLAARRHLAERFLEGDVGITGANFLIASSGSVVIVENENNARLCTSLPRRQVVLAGVEKLPPSESALGVLLPLLTVTATGQPAAGVVNLLTPRFTPMDVVLLDNGRMNLLRDGEFRDVLACIRCGGCMNICPVYRHAGGHPYGGAYAGPIGAVLRPLLEGMDEAGDLPFASSLCGACAEICPVKIPLDRHLLRLRALARHGPAERAGFRAWAFAARRPALFRLAAAIWRKLPFLADLLPPGRAWKRGRELPPPPRESFEAWWEGRKKEEGHGRPGA